MSQPVIEGTQGADNLSVSVSGIIVGFSGHDTLTGSAFSDNLYGGNTQWSEGGLHPDYQGAYMFWVGDNDIINGGAGDDFIMVGTGRDTIDGGDNYDQINFQFANWGSFFEEVDGTGTNPKPRFKETTGTLWGIKVDLGAGTYSGRYYADSKLVGTNGGTVWNVESVIGSVGHDSIRGSSADNAFKPIGGNDTIDGAGGFDILSYDDLATKGIVLKFGTGTVKDGFGGTDQFSNIEHATGSKHNDELTGSAGAQFFTGGKGDDTIDGIGGTDTVDYSREAGTKAIKALLGRGEVRDTFGDTDTLDNIENIKGTTRGDTILGSSSKNAFWGNDGNDRLEGSGGDDTLHGGDGGDTIEGGDDDDLVYGNVGADRIEGGSGRDTLHGGDDNDTMTGDEGDDSINGDAGDDTITDHRVHADFFSGGSAGNTIDGGAGEDKIKGTGILRGGTENDTIEGAGRLYGDAGDDTLKVGPTSNFGPTSMEGGEGKDTLIDSFDHSTGQYGIADYSYAGIGILALLNEDRVTVTSTDADTLTGIVALRGSDHGDTIDGSQADDSRFMGGGGHDSIRSHNGDDYIDGGAGNDTIDSGSGKDTVEGGTGNDSVDAGSKNDGVDGGEGKDTLRGGSGNDTIVGGAGNDVLAGDAGDDRLRGDGGDDTISTGSGNNTVDGGAGEDKILIEGTDAFVQGGADSDILTNKAKGRAYMVGGTGTDTFEFLPAVSAGRQAVIADFDKAREKIDLRAFDDDIGPALTFSGLKASAEDLSGGEVKIQVLSTFHIIIEGMTKAELRADDFLL
jgi:Ca2+-binding RTX toxin-like protein